MKIMIVDDHEGIRKKIRELLARPGVEAREYATGEEAIPAARTLQPDWIIMDVYLPGINGLEVTKTIHREVPSARIIVISTNDQHYLREAARDAGAEEFLSKHQLADLPGILNGSLRDAR